MHPGNLSIVDFTYELPDEKIAKYPLPERDSSRLLVYRNGQIAEDSCHNVDTYLPKDSLLLLNNTKVIEARLIFQKSTGALIEIFCLEPYSDQGDITSAMSQTQQVDWLCLIGGASKWKPGQVLQKKINYLGSQITVEVRFIRKVNNSFAVNVSWFPAELSFAEILHHAGTIPLPPYLKREADESDTERYQTVYADSRGSVAAPTAGLHFTASVLEKLEQKLEIEHLTLHVGAGTFKPVKSEVMEQHEMHAEFIEVRLSTIQKIYDHNGFITAVGTTSLRTIESLYWLGVKAFLNREIDIADLALGQWEAYELSKEKIPIAESLEALVDWMSSRNLNTLITKTQVLIAPGYEFKLVDALVTNFHQPQSTLLLLVAAFVGEDWRKIYEYALDKEFRFLSYGDGSLLFRNSSLF